MKNITYIFLILILFGCKKIMHEPEYDISQIKTIAEMDVAMNGIYARLAQYINNPNTSPQYLADDMPLIQDNSSTYLYNYERFEYSSYGDYNWQKLYNIIVSANNFIYRVKSNTNISNEMKIYLGEVYLLRAYAYFRLVRIFGAVPIVVDIEVKSTLPKTSIKDVYAFIESDLLKAANYLPVSKGMARVPGQSPTRGSAKAMFAEVYLTMGGYPLLDNTKYIQAAQVAKEVMDSAGVFGCNLLPDYANLWDVKHILNNETLFGLFFSTQAYKIVKHYVSYSQSNATWYEFNLNQETGNYFTPGISYWNDIAPYVPYNQFSNSNINSIIPNPIFYNNFPASYRKDVTFQNIINLNLGSSIAYTTDTMHYVQTWYYKIYNTFDGQMFYKKFGYAINIDTLFTIKEYGHKQIDYWADQFHLDYVSDSISDTIYKHISLSMGQPIYIYRYAHTLLTYAEAKARSSQLDASAYEAVNMVRRRANKVDIYSTSNYDLQPGLSSTQFIDSVVQERAWEFCAEPEGRWYDLLRLEMIEQLPKLKSYPTPPIPVFTKSDYFEAIPSGDKALNPNL